MCDLLPRTPRHRAILDSTTCFQIIRIIRREFLKNSISIILLTARRTVKSTTFRLTKEQKHRTRLSRRPRATRGGSRRHVVTDRWRTIATAAGPRTRNDGAPSRTVARVNDDNGRVTAKQSRYGYAPLCHYYTHDGGSVETSRAGGGRSSL